MEDFWARYIKPSGQLGSDYWIYFAERLVDLATIPKDATVKQRMHRKLRTEKGRAAYAKRKQTVEPVFGQIKQARGFRRFLLRGLKPARAEWRLMCLGHNLLKLVRSGALSAVT